MTIRIGSTPMARVGGYDRDDLRELGKAIRAVDQVFSRAGNFTCEDTVAGTTWTQLLGSPWQIILKEELDLEIAAELQWELTQATSPSATNAPFEARIQWDNFIIRTSKVQLVQSFVLTPAPATIAAGSLHVMAPIQTGAAGIHRLEVEIQAPASTTWTVLSTSTIRYATYAR